MDVHDVLMVEAEELLWVVGNSCFDMGLWGVRVEQSNRHSIHK